MADTFRPVDPEHAQRGAPGWRQATTQYQFNARP